MAKQKIPWPLVAALAAGLAYFLFARPAQAATSSAAPPGGGEGGADLSGLGLGGPLAFEGATPAASKLEKIDFGFLTAVAASVQKFRNPFAIPGGISADHLLGGSSSAAPSAGSGGYGGGGGGGQAGRAGRQLF